MIQKEKPVSSPCVEVCALDDHDICIGCHRSGDEILRWGLLNNDERRAVVARCAERAHAAGLLKPLEK